MSDNLDEWKEERDCLLQHGKPCASKSIIKANIHNKSIFFINFDSIPMIEIMQEHRRRAIINVHQEITSRNDTRKNVGIDEMQIPDQSLCPNLTDIKHVTSIIN